MVLYKNSPKRYFEDNGIYFIVVKTHNNYPYFKEPIFCDLLIEEIKICKEMKGFKLFGFSIIYDHLNLLIQSSKECNISKVIQFIKRHFTRDINYIINYTAVGDIRECRLRGGEYERYEKIIKNHDEVLKQLKKRFIQKYGFNQTTFPKFKWQKSFYDHIIRGEHDFGNKYIYTVYNHQKHHLSDSWKYTSLNYEDMTDKILI